MRNNGTVEGVNFNTNTTTTTTTTTTTVAHHQHHRCLTVELLTGEQIVIPYEGKTTCNTIWRGVEGELVARGVVHPQIFGLAIKSGSDWVFVDPDAKLSKYYPNICKEGKSQSQTHLSTAGSGSVSDGKKPAFHCRVHFYLDALPQNFDVISLHHYYLQLRQNLISAPRFPPASVVQPLAYAFQFELGDWRPCQELPRWTSSQPLFSSLANSIVRAHQMLSSLGKDAARLAFIRAVMPQYNMHLFGMTLKTKEDKYAPAWVGVTPKGIEVYQNAVGCNEIPAQPRLTFLWANITKLFYERKKYGIRGQAFPWGNSTQKLTFTALTESVPQHLLHLCRSTHQFHLSNHKILTASESLNGGGQTTSGGGKGSSSLGEGSTSGGGESTSSCNSTLLSSSSKNNNNEDKMLDLSLWADGLLLTGESSEHQRVSVISNASSNTTSGIVSDRVYSLDGSEAEDLEMRELPDCCTERAHNRNSTSLESLSQRHPPPPRLRHNHHNLAIKRAHSHSHHSHLAAASSSSNPNANVVVNGTSSSNNNSNTKCGAPGGEDDSESKHWYCDSDCEDCDDATGPCRSMLVRTIGDKRGGGQMNKCAGHCECNSCVTDEEQDEEDDDLEEDECDGHHHFHHNTPSMASETTLKAVDFGSGVSSANNGSLKYVESGVIGAKNSDCGAEHGKQKVQMMEGEGEESVVGGEVGEKDGDDTDDGGGEIEEYKLEDEHVYGEISEDPGPPLNNKSGGNSGGGGGIITSGDAKLKTEKKKKCRRRSVSDQRYSTIEDQGDEGVEAKAPKPKPRYSCIKSVEQPQQKPERGCNKCRGVKDKCCNPSRTNKHTNCKKLGDQSSSNCSESNNVNNNKSAKSTCAKDCKKCLSASASNVASSTAAGAGGAKDNGLTPKVASLKCLRKAKPSCSSNNNARRHTSSRHHNHQHRGEINFSELPPVNYVEFGEKLQQGRYPSTRTVSDNFDTDSDYVQLPPLAWYPPPRPPPKKPNSLKLWKCVSKSAHGKPKQASPPSLSPPVVNLSTLPRRKSSELSCGGDGGGEGSGNNRGCQSSLVTSRLSSRSTNAINLVGHAKPEPPPKPRKSLADLTTIGRGDDGGNNEYHNIKTGGVPVVDARFIATKPQILIQTAYATTAPVAIPSQAQVLVRGSKVLGNITPIPTNGHLTTSLQHSQSVDNIYDTVASEEPSSSAFAVPSAVTPPPYYLLTKTSAPLIIRPNNYIDVHASSVKSKLSTSTKGNLTSSAIGNHYIANPSTTAASAVGGGGVFMGKNIGNRCGSVPNINNFLIGLQNLKPLSRTPIVHPAGATSCLTLNNNNNHGSTQSHAQCVQVQMQQPNSATTTTSSCSSSSGACPNNNNNPRFTTVYTNQLTRSQINRYKAQLYSDIDYVIFPPKDPRVSQQEYFDSKYTASTNSNPMLNPNNAATSAAYQLNDIPPPYLPPPPPYPSTAAVGTCSNGLSNIPPPLPKKNPKMATRPLPNPHSSTNVTSSLSNHSIPATMATTTTGPPCHHNSFQSIYHPGSTNSHCSSSQYGYYTATAVSGGLNSENLQRFLSTQSFTGSHGSSAPIYYPSSVQSAPPLPPYKPSGHVIIENGMRKAVQQMMCSRNSAALTASDERLRMNIKLCRSEESLYSQPTNESMTASEEQFQAIHNLPPPPPYKRPASNHPTFSSKQEAFSAAELDLAYLRARCHALELPLLRALCSEGEMLNKNTSTKAIMQAAKNRMIRPTAHAHPKLSLPPKNPLPIPPKPNNNSNHNSSSNNHNKNTTTNK